MSNRRYLTSSELGLASGDNKPSDAPAEGKKYLSAEELMNLQGGEPKKATASRSVFNRVVMPEAANKVNTSQKYDDGDVNGTLASIDLDELDGVPRKSAQHDSLAGIPGISIAQASVPTAPRVTGSIKSQGGVPEAVSSSSANVQASAQEEPSVQRPVGRRGQSSAAFDMSPLSAGVMSYLDSHLPEDINFISEERAAEAIESLRNGASYSIGSQLARGAESLLYQGKCGNYNFLVKSIRNWKDHWIGDTRTRKDTGKLAESVEYATKLRHLTNEFSVGQSLRDDSGNPVPVQIYSLRRVTRVGLELGWDLLMERINGIDLSDKKLVGAMTIADKVRVCIRMAQAIGVLHAKRLVHLDIKPSNFILDRNGVIRLIDFGISVATGYQSRTVAGTAGYFSPEQIACKTLSEDTDVFALGVTYNVLFGGRLLVQTPDEAKSRQYRHDALSDLEKNNLSAIGEIPELTGPYKPLAELIRSCSILRRASRISNCVVLVNKLRQVAEECGIQL